MAAITLPEFAGGLPAARVDESLRLALAAVDRARECAVLWFAEVARRSLYRELGFASLELYAVEGLGFSRDRYFQFRRLAEDLERLPLLKEAVASGEVGWTKAQQVARVATPASEARWVARAAAVGRRELAGEVKQARREANGGSGRRARREELRADPPTTVSFRLDGLQLARYEALLERAYKLGLVPPGAGREEVLLSALEALTEGGDLCRHKSRQVAVLHPDRGAAVSRLRAGRGRHQPWGEGAVSGAGGGGGVRCRRPRCGRPEPRDHRAIGARRGAGARSASLHGVRGDAIPRGPSPASRAQREVRTRPTT